MRALILLTGTVAAFLFLAFQSPSETRASRPSIRVAPLAVSAETIATEAPGDLVVVRYDANDVTEGNAQPVRIDGPGSGNCSISDSYCRGMREGSANAVCPVSIVDACDGASLLRSEPGNKVAPTRLGLEFRRYSTPAPCAIFEDVFLPNYAFKQVCDPFAPDYEGASKVMLLPIVLELCNGSCEVTVTDIGIFFLEGFSEESGALHCSGNNCEFHVRFAGTLLTGAGRPACGVHMLQRIGVPPGRGCRGGNGTSDQQRATSD